MKKIYISVFFALLLIISCISNKKVSKTESKPHIESIEKETSSDSTEYELIIMDPRYDVFLATQPPKEFYSNSYYQTWNIQYVVEWNIRHSNPLQYGDFYETQIDYSPNIDYGIDLNYKLYNYFLFIDKEYGIKLINRAKP